VEGGVKSRGNAKSVNCAARETQTAERGSAVGPSCKGARLRGDTLLMQRDRKTVGGEARSMQGQKNKEKNRTRNHLALARGALVMAWRRNANKQPHRGGKENLTETFSRSTREWGAWRERGRLGKR